MKTGSWIFDFHLNSILISSVLLMLRAKFFLLAPFIHIFNHHLLPWLIIAHYSSNKGVIIGEFKNCVYNIETTSFLKWPLIYEGCILDFTISHDPAHTHTCFSLHFLCCCNNTFCTVYFIFCMRTTSVLFYSCMERSAWIAGKIKFFTVAWCTRLISESNKPRKVR